MNKKDDALRTERALKLALEALEPDWELAEWYVAELREKAITAIKAALAEQPAQGCDYCNHPQYAGTKCKNCGREQPAQQQEPVAKVCPDLPGSIGWNPKLTQLPDEGTAFYTSPPASKPLTDEQMFELAEIAWRHGWASCRDAEYVGEEAEDERWGMIGAEVVQNIATHGIKSEQPN